MTITGKTRVVGLFGYPIEHSLSPIMQNAAFNYQGLDYCYVAFLVHPELLKEAVNSIRALNLAGVNVTVPHKENVIPFLDRINEEASFIGAVNTIKNENGTLIGYNTDGKGFMKSLEEANIIVKNKNVLIIGCGGASRAIGYYLCTEASSVYLYDIDKKKVNSLKVHLNKLKENVHILENISEQNKHIISSIDIIINATPLGLKTDDPLPIDINLLNKDHIVCDLIYKDTPLLKEALKKGCKIINGLGMLLWQGVFAYEIWTGIKPPVDIMRKALNNAALK